MVMPCAHPYFVGLSPDLATDGALAVSYVTHGAFTAAFRYVSSGITICIRTLHFLHFRVSRAGNCCDFFLVKGVMQPLSFPKASEAQSCIYSQNIGGIDEQLD